MQNKCELHLMLPLPRFYRESTPSLDLSPAPSTSSGAMGVDFANRQRFSGQCDTTECAEKVDAMLSTAILHQEDVWNLLVENAPEGAAVDPLTGETSTVAVDPKVLKAMKQKLENAIDWCQLAQTRLKSLLSNQGQ